MDEDLRQYIDSAFDSAFTRFSQHILHEMSIRFGEVDTKLTSIDQRLTLQAGVLQGGARAMARFSAFAENSEERWVDLTKRMGALERKVEKLGGNGSA